MSNISIAFLAAVLLASFGCKNKGGGEVVAKMTEFKDRMCACKNKACTDKVTEDMTKWNQELAKTGGDKEAKLNDDAQNKVMLASDEMTRCLQKIASTAGS